MREPCRQTERQKKTDNCRRSLSVLSCLSDITDSCNSQITMRVCLLWAGCSTSQQHASVSQGRICSDNFTCCHTEIEPADPTFHLTQSQYTDTRLTSPSTDPIMPGAWQGRAGECQFLSHWYDSTWKDPIVSGIRTLGSSTLEANSLTTRPTRRSQWWGVGGGGMSIIRTLTVCNETT